MDLNPCTGQTAEPPLHHRSARGVRSFCSDVTAANRRLRSGLLRCRAATGEIGLRMAFEVHARRRSLARRKTRVVDGRDLEPQSDFLGAWILPANRCPVGFWNLASESDDLLYCGVVSDRICGGSKLESRPAAPPRSNQWWRCDTSNRSQAPQRDSTEVEREPDTLWTSRGSKRTCPIDFCLVQSCRMQYFLLSHAS